MLSADLRACLDLLPSSALVADAAGAIVFANAAAHELLQQAPSTLSGQSLSQWLTLRNVSRLTQAEPMSLVAADVAGERWLRDANGQRHRVEVTAKAIELAEQPCLLLLLNTPKLELEQGLPVGDAFDELEPTDLSEALRRDLERLRHATHAAQVGIFDHPVNPEPPRPPYWSPTLRAMLGVMPDEPANFEWFRGRIHADDVHLIDSAIEHSMGPNGDGSIEIEYRWLHPDRGVRWLLNRSVTNFAHLDGQRVPQRSIGAILDVTERRALEQDKRLRATILDATPDFVAISLLDGRFVYLNRAARTFLGIDDAEPLEGHNLDEAHPPAVVQLLHSVAIPTAVARGSWSAETEFVRPDGTAVPMSHLVLAQRDASGDVAHLCTIARDLSKERALEEQFRQAQKMEAIGRLAAGVAHDFNNLLSVILGYANIVGTEFSRGHDPQHSLKEIVRAAERAAALTSQLLAFGRKQILKPRVLDVNDVLSDFTPMVSRLIGERTQLHVIPAPHPANIRADRNQIQQVLLNLVVNARDAMAEGGVLTLEAFRVTLEAGASTTKLNLVAGVYTVIAVSDTGHGMDGAVRERIFEPFFTTKRPGEGTGLGLATVFGIVQQSGGSIWVYSEPGRGTTFKIYLPCTDEPADMPLPPPPRVDVAQGGVILLSEDDEQVRGMVNNVLLRAGYQVLSAGSGAEALALADGHAGTIDLLLTDVVMPGMSGTMLAERLHQRRPDVPVLFTSGYTDNTIVHQGVLDDGVDFLAKPITPGRLLTAILEILQRSKHVRAS